MGFRSTFTTYDHRLEMPKWFMDKYPYVVCDNGCITTLHEVKTYYGDLIIDMQKALQDAERLEFPFVLVWLHECGGITKVIIREDKIRYLEPTKWEEVEQVTHDYCYGCSE